MTRDDREVKRIFLIGLRGSGKSTVGVALANRLGLPFLDMDGRIEQQEGKSIKAIFQSEGEARFREIESNLLAEICDSVTEGVIATGGGVVLSEQNRALLKDKTVLWLHASPETLWARTDQDPSTTDRRPRLDPKAQTGLDEMIAMSAQRERLYESCAGEIVSTEELEVPTIVEQILTRLGVR